MELRVAVEFATAVASLNLSEYQQSPYLKLLENMCFEK